MSLDKALDKAFGKKEEKVETPTRIYIPSKPITVDGVVDDMIEHLKNCSSLNGDELFIQKILTDPRDYKHRNSTYKRKVLKDFLQILIKMNKIKK